MSAYTQNYLLNKKIKIFQGEESYRTSSDAVLLSSLVENVKPNEKILDVGSGTGGISLCLAERFSDAQITGLEIQPELVELSNLSAQENRFENLNYLLYDITEKNTQIPFCSFDVVVTNPPYSEHDAKSPNISKATAHNHTTSLENWLGFCLKMLKPYGRLYTINRAEALDDICRILYKKAGGLKVIPLYSKKGQNAKRVMIMAQKDSKTPLKIFPPFYVHQEDGAYTLQAEQILRDGKSFFCVDFF